MGEEGLRDGRGRGRRAPSAALDVAAGVAAPPATVGVVVGPIATLCQDCPITNDIRLYKILILSTSVLKICNFGFGSRQISLNDIIYKKNFVNIYNWVWIESIFLKFDQT